MKKGLVILLVVLGLIGLGLISGIGMYNGLVSLQEDVNEKWAQVQNVYQRRADLVPNLVNTVKGYAVHEKSTLESVIQARASATQISAGAMNNILNDPQALQKFDAAQGGLTSALSKLMVVVEQYPDLKANQNFLALQSQLEGTENRITVERMRFNESAKAYNVKIRQFPSSIFAKLFGFEKKAMFEAQEAAQTAPKVEF